MSRLYVQVIGLVRSILPRFIVCRFLSHGPRTVRMSVTKERGRQIIFKPPDILIFLFNVSGMVSPEIDHMDIVTWYSQPKCVSTLHL